MAPFFMLDNFLDFLTTQKRFSEHTCTAYKKDILQFLKFSGIQSEVELRELDHKLIRGWIVELVDGGYESTSVNRKLSTLRTYFKWLLKEGSIDVDPTSRVQGPKVRKRPPSFAQQGELDVHKLSACFEDSFDGIRDRLLLEMLYQTGIRSSELVNLQDKNVQSNQIKVLGKRNKERIVPISKGLVELIEQYRLHRKELSLKTDCFFVRNTGEKLYPKFVYSKINHYLGLVTDLKKRSPHVLRHTFATHMLNNGAGLEVLKELLGHASLSATQVYTHNSFTELTQIYSQSHPRGRKN